MSELLDQARDLTREAWSTDEFRRITDALELEITSAAKQGRFWTTVVYNKKERAQAVVSWLRDKGFDCVMKSQDEKGKEFGNAFVTVSWGPRAS